jgi:hypothetical protein
VTFSAAETAEILGTTTAAVKSGLQRARARLDEREPDPDALLEPADPRARALLDGYIAAFERSDAGLTAANGQPAAAVYHRDPVGVLRAHGIVVLDPTVTGISRVVEFHHPVLVATFGFPDVLAD